MQRALLVWRYALLVIAYKSLDLQCCQRFCYGGLLIIIGFDWSFLYNSFATPVAGSIVYLSSVVPVTIAVGPLGTLFQN